MELKSEQARRLARFLISDEISEDQVREFAWLLMTNEQARQLARKVIGADVCSQAG